MKRRSVIAQLRERYPDENFQAVKRGMSWKYVGWTMTVGVYSQFAPKYDGDDESAITVYVDNKGRELGACGVIYR